MREKSRLVVGIDQTWTVTDHALHGDLEVKYTVDASGTELLLYRDGVAGHVLRKDRFAVLRSRLLTRLPRVARRRVAHWRREASRVRVAVREAAHRRRSRRPRLRAAGLVALGPLVRPWLGALVTAHDAKSEENFQREQVLEVFRAAGVEAAVLPGGTGKRAVVVIRHEDRERAVHALARALDEPWYVVPLDTRSARPRRITVRSLQRQCAQSDGFRVFRYVAAGPDRGVAGAALGCDVEVWRSPRPALLHRPAPPLDYSGHLVAPRRNVWAHLLGPDTWQDAGSRAGHLVDVGSLPHIFDVNVPIDVVYTWVDGADPEWLEAKNEALRARGHEPRPADAVDEARFRSHDELRYSLRSLEIYAPWVRRVHIVTAGQRPAWLDVENPRLRLVDHRDIFADPSVLPVFNSHAIESQLHHVPGLAEHYLYLNDDVFFGRLVTRDQFFHGNGLAKFFLSSAVMGLGPRKIEESAHAQAAKNNRAWLAERVGRTVSHHFQHGPHPQLRSVLAELEREDPETFARVSASAFRDPEDLSIASSLHHYYAYATGRAVPGRLEYLYLDLNHPGAAQRLGRLLLRREFDVFCINDTPGPPRDEAGKARMLRDFFERYFPLPSSFELPGA